MKLQAKQIHKLLGLPLTTPSIEVTGTSFNITSVLTSLLTTAGFNASAVDLTPSADETEPGVVTLGNNRVVLVLNPSGFTPLSAVGDVVYGRITEAAGVYTLSFYTLSVLGVETVHSFPTTDISVVFLYRFALDKAPTDLSLLLSGVNKNSLKRVIVVTAQTSLAIPYDQTFFGLAPIVAFWDSDFSNNLVIVQASLDDLVNPTQLNINFGPEANGLLVIM